MRLAGKVALVTGGSRGIGKAIALELAAEGVDLVVAARTVERRRIIPGTIGETAEAVRTLGRRALAVKTDLTRREEIDRLAAETLDAFGRLDFLVNNAADTGRDVFASFWDTDAESWSRQFAVNVTAPFLLCKAFAGVMRDQGGGLIVNVTSGAAAMADPPPRRPGVAGATYGPTKAALNRMTQALAADFYEANVSIVSVDPGYTLTEIAEIVGTSQGLDPSEAQSMDVTAKTVAHLATCHNPLWYSGKVVVAADLVQEHNLL